MKIAVIGCGYWGKNLTRNLAELGVLFALCDLNLEHAQNLAIEYGVPALDLETLLASDVDGVMIAASSGQHHLLTKKALLAGKHVFVEKPFTLKLTDAKDLHDLALKQQRKLMIGHLLQYHPAFLSLNRLTKRGELGEVRYIYSTRLNFGHFKYDENILWDFAPHDLSMILTLASDVPTSVFATGICQVQPGSHDLATINLNFENNMQAQIFVSRLHPYKEQKLIVIGDQGMAVFDDGLPWQEKLKLYQHRVQWLGGAVPTAASADAINIALNPLEPLKLECQHFIDCIQNNQQPRTDAKEALAVIQVLHAAQQSLQQNTKISLQKQTKKTVHEIALG